MRSFRCVVALLMLLPLACGKTERSGKLVPVSGQVKMDGKPLANADVTFFPSDPAGTQTKHASGRTDSDGRYTLKPDSEEGEGVASGLYKVNISLFELTPTEGKPARGQVVPKKYNTATTLTITVPAEGTKEANFPDLTSK